jgi:hypothetical protein
MHSRNEIQIKIITIALSLIKGSEMMDIINLIIKVIEKKNPKPILNPLLGEVLSKIAMRAMDITIAIDERAKLKSS